MTIRAPARMFIGNFVSILCMNKIFRNTLLSVCVANFVGLNFFVIFLMYRNPGYKVVSMSQALSDYLEIAALFFAIGLCISLVFAILIGWPLYWIARRKKMVNWVTGLSSGVLVVVVPWGLLIMFGWNLPSILEQNGLLTILMLGICGTIGGILFYKLAVDQRD